MSFSATVFFSHGGEPLAFSPCFRYHATSPHHVGNMSYELLALMGTAASLGFLHTLVGPDHYVPFVAMARAGKWSRTKTITITVLSGLGHVGSSVLIGALGIAFGSALAHLQWVEEIRGAVAAWLLTGFGLAYMVWGIRRAIRSKQHQHSHAHVDGEIHAHTHSHDLMHAHPHTSESSPSITPWVIFSIFVFGPCEPLIPLLMYPAAVHSTAGVALVAIVFALTTIGTMLAMVFLGLAGVELLPFPQLERYMHATAGGIIALLGLGILFLGM
jgi:nickel/cobalt transporter (NicO) family protein